MVCGFLIFVVASCKENPTEPREIDQPPLTELEIADDFSFSTLQEVSIKVDVQNLDGSPKRNIRVQVSDRPFPATGNLGLIGDGYTNPGGRYNAELKISSIVEKLYIRTDMIGTRNYAELDVAENLQHVFSVGPQINLISSGKRNRNNRIDASHFEEPRNTGANMSIIINDITGIEIVDEAELACITPDGLIAGVEMISGDPPYGMAVWGDDFTSEDVDGFRAGEELAFLYWDPPRKEEIVAEATAIQGNLTYTTNGFAEIELIVEPKGRFRYLGNWDSNGVPDYLDDTSERIDLRFNRLSSNFPEGVNIEDTYPDFVRQHSTILLSAEADLWISFVHNGSLNHSPFGFYSYSGSEIPQNPRDLGELKIIFPNPSREENGSGLHPGDKVHIGRFDENTTVGWFLLSQGWQNNAITNGDDLFYSNSNLNPETNGNLKRHCMLFFEEGSERLILGIEDERRDQENDHDFNDVIMAITVSPEDAIDMHDIPSLESIAQLTDIDTDGVPDVIDHWPNDINSCFGSYFPSWSQNFALAFEDDWPGIGDYDFNDMVVNSNFKQILNSEGFVTSISSSFSVQAAGSDKNNGFGFMMPITSNNILSVSGSNISGNYITLTGTGVEAGQENTVIIVFDDVLSFASPAGGFSLINTEPGSPEVSPERINVTVQFEMPVSFTDLGSAPYNPFIIIDGQRSHEVHLADYPPTSLADLNLFGTEEDKSSTESGFFYKSQYNLPWALVIPVVWQQTNEGSAINQAYTDFGNWAESNGNTSKGWFNTNINTDHIWSGR